MQFIPAQVDPRVNSGQADITFCNHKELDPVLWDDKCLETLEEYVSYLKGKELLKSGKLRGEITGLIQGIGLKYNVTDLLRATLNAQVVVLTANAELNEPVTPQEQTIIDTTSAVNHPTTQFFSTLRLIVLETLKERDYPTYETKKGLWLQNYDRIKFIFEERTMKILSPPVFICTSNDHSQENVSVKIIHDRTSDQLHHMYRDLYYATFAPDTGYEKHSFLTRWLSDDTKKTYATCAFDPKGTIPGNFNTFFGFRAEGIPRVIDIPRATQHVQMILNHIKEIYCDNVDAHAVYIFKWLANIVKYPWKKTEVLVLIFGVEGCGKGMIIDFFAHKVLGQHLTFQTASPGVDLFSKFAIGAHRKLLCFCDEAGEDLSKHHDQLKNLITSKTIRIEKKGQDIRTEDNFINIIVASNNAGPVRISPHDRRVVAFQCDEKYKENYNYFSALAEATSSDECARHMYEFLLQYDLPADYNFQATRPITKYYESLQAASLPIFFRFLSFKCGNFQGSDGSVTKVQARTLFGEFKDWKTERGYENTYTECRFGRDLNDLIVNPDCGVKRVRRNNVIYEIRFDVLQTFLIRKKKFDENAF
jgi:hypothetical protein